jgi:hypothetical protein
VKKRPCAGIDVLAASGGMSDWVKKRPCAGIGTVFSAQGD